MRLSHAQRTALITLNTPRVGEKTKYDLPVREQPANMFRATTLGILCQLGLVNVESGKASLTKAGTQLAESWAPPTSAEPNHEDD